MEAQPDAVIFDNDGLLLDTESVWTRAERDIFERRKVEFSAAHKRELVGTSAEECGRLLEQRLEEPGKAFELIEELNELVIAELEHGVEAMVGARELLHRLKERGTPIGLVSKIVSTSCSAPTKWRRRSHPPTPTSRPAGGWGSSRLPPWSCSRTRPLEWPPAAPPA